ncbi:MAG TPA: molybdenum cofactor guanylyltransferase [Dokdonella sp.]|uniref:molybdenum cofactor guanylyltransferase n=1 Tax=Dokdonella sp. TaxID=2291710 RepID=UPI002D7ED585|nr:molybdenum cofactor guanylyltransferase [Dokdonella sp.]HET9031616.1 molybdenum cofactor guanylyltransferase [Dokdonella sp.]
MSQLAQHSRSMTTAILAGGAATRLGGVDKGLVALHGRPLIAWVVESRQGGSESPCLVVANRNLESYSRYAPTITDQSPVDFKGPLAGIVAALLACETDWLFTVPVDCLRIPRGLGVDLIEHALANDASAAVAHDGERRQPLFAVYRRGLAESAKSALDDGNGVSRWQDRIGALELVCPDPGLDWFNLNTAEDFAAMTEDVRNRE